MNDISVNDLKNIGEVNIIDIRNEEKYNDNHILNAYNIPFNKIITHPDRYLDKNSIYYIYCQKGNRSKQVCTILKRNGYNVVNIIGGYEMWILSE